MGSAYGRALLRILSVRPGSYGLKSDRGLIIRDSMDDDSTVREGHLPQPPVQNTINNERGENGTTLPRRLHGNQRQ